MFVCTAHKIFVKDHSLFHLVDVKNQLVFLSFYKFDEVNDLILIASHVPRRKTNLNHGHTTQCLARPAANVRTRCNAIKKKQLPIDNALPVTVKRLTIVVKRFVAQFLISYSVDATTKRRNRLHNKVICKLR